ncbi:MAG: GNAT family N-acetyltransferase [Thermotogaceae bacterium]|nr:GNAT family N-acetyltransferase [Thermotogaceae bacterium]
MKLLLDYAFNYLNLYKINLEVYEYNKKAIEFYKKLGFKIQGKLIENNERFGKRHDVIVMGMTKKEYFGKEEDDK